MDQIITLPLDTICEDRLPRDRSSLDPDQLFELRTSIATDGQRQPIEVWKLSTPNEAGQEYGLISGLRRLTAHKELNTLRPGAFATIHAFLRQPANIAEAMAAMISENEVRADLTPWDKGRIIMDAVHERIFDSVDDAIKGLHPTASKQKRGIIRALAHVVEELDGMFSTPQRLSFRKMMQLAPALRGGLTDLIYQILKENRGVTLEAQWDAILPALAEAARNEPETPATSTSPARPRRLLDLKQGLTIRREWSKAGWKLCFSGEEARKGALMEDVMDYVERLFQPGFSRH